MKNLLLLAFSVLLLTGCGVGEHLGKNCGGDLKELCYNVFGGRVDNDQQGQIDVHSGQIDSLQQQFDALNATLGHVQLQLNVLGVQETSLQSQIDALSAQNSSQDAAIAALQASLAVTNSTIVSLQNINNTTLAQLAVLTGYQNIADIFDPCGHQGAYNEVFLHLSSGKYVASFSENGSALTTRFTVLQDGSYVTTDGTHCYFTVSGGGTVISGQHN